MLEHIVAAGGVPYFGQEHLKSPGVCREKLGFKGVQVGHVLQLCGPQGSVFPQAGGRLRFRVV